jgi:hypothetical protein
MIATLSARKNNANNPGQHKSVFVAQKDPFYSVKNQAVLLESIAQLDAGLGTVHELIEVEGDETDA